jgi:ABC-type polysaccharide/polyol phosphate export permease
MRWNKGIRQTHRWLSIAFTVAVIIVTIAVVGEAEPAEWLYYLPLPPLFLLLFTGLYLFVLPYVTKGRSERRSE